MERLYNGQSLSASVDETGRIVLPLKQRQKIDIEDKAYFVAMGDTFQIWKPETYHATEAPIDALLDKMPDGADIWTLLEDDAGD